MSFTDYKPNEEDNELIICHQCGIVFDRLTVTTYTRDEVTGNKCAFRECPVCGLKEECDYR